MTDNKTIDVPPASQPSTRSGLVALVPHGLTLSRAVLGICFPWIPQQWQLWVILVAAFTDLADGFASRVLRVADGSGRYLDPIVDKVFVLGVVVTLVRDQVLSVPQVLLLGLRDLAVIVGTAVLCIFGRTPLLRRLAPTVLGKLTTAAQFLFFLVLVIAPQQAPFLFIAAASLSGLTALDYVLLSLIEARTVRDPATNTARGLSQGEQFPPAASAHSCDESAHGIRIHPEE